MKLGEVLWSVIGCWHHGVPPFSPPPPPSFIRDVQDKSILIQILNIFNISNCNKITSGEMLEGKILHLKWGLSSSHVEKKKRENE